MEERTINRRRPIHPVANKQPRPDMQSYHETKADIQKHGQQLPIVCYKGQVIDGVTRQEICFVLGITPKYRDLELERADWTDEELEALSLSLNLHRRHLTQEQKRELIDKLLDAAPEKSDRQIAETAGVSPPTVGAARKKRGGKSLHLGKRTGRDGKKYSPPKKKAPISGNAEDRDHLAVAKPQEQEQVPESGNTEDRDHAAPSAAPAYADEESIAPVMGAIAKLLEGLRKELQKVPPNIHPECRQHVREGLVSVAKHVADYIKGLDAVASAVSTNGTETAPAPAVLVAQESNESWW